METNVTYTHRIYGRERGKGRFKPIDLKNGRFVVNLIYASMLPSCEVDKVLTDLIDQNSDMEFKAVKFN